MATKPKRVVLNSDSSAPTVLYLPSRGPCKLTVHFVGTLTPPDARTVAAFVYECFLVRSGGLEPVTDSHQHGNMIPSSGASLMSGDLAGGDEWSTSLSMCSICD